MIHRQIFFQRLATAKYPVLSAIRLLLTENNVDDVGFVDVSHAPPKTFHMKRCFYG